MDKYKVKLLPRALRDLDEIYGYISQVFQEPGTAESLLDEIEAQIFSLEEMPERFQERQHGYYAGKGYRELGVKNYTAIYRVDKAAKLVTIVTVRYSGSDF